MPSGKFRWMKRPKIRLIVPKRPLYNFVTMPFGLCNTLQSMQRLMDEVILFQLRHQVFIYLDDFLLITKPFDQHLLLLSELALCIRSTGLTFAKEEQICHEGGSILGASVIGQFVPILTKCTPSKIFRSLKLSNNYGGFWKCVDGINELCWITLCWLHR